MTHIIVTLLLFSCSVPTVKEEVPLIITRQPAEFETQNAVWLIWPPVDHKEGESVQEITLSIIEALIDGLHVVVTCGTDELCSQAREVLGNRFKESQNLTIQALPSIEIWVRDMGPVFVETNQNTLAVADFNFNAWGYSDTVDTYTKTEEMYDIRAAELLNLPVISSPMISEGGNREVNGKGTLLVTEAVEKGRNPTMSKAEMEAEYKRLLGVKKTIWLKQGLNEDDHTFLGPLDASEGVKAYTVVTTNGHIDEFARFVNDSTILLAEVDNSDLEDPIALENYYRMEENYRILSRATDQDGKPFHIIRMPLPKTMLTTMGPGDYVYEYIKTLDYQDGSTFPEGDTITVVPAASYLNFLITNSVIIGQKYWREGMPEVIKLRDEKAAAILQSVFPNRIVIMLDAMAVNLGGGGIHCISMQQPISMRD